MNLNSTNIGPINLLHSNLAVLYIGLFTFTGQSFVLRQHRLQMPDFCSQLFDLHGAVYLSWYMDQQKLTATHVIKVLWFTNLRAQRCYKIRFLLNSFVASRWCGRAFGLEEFPTWLLWVVESSSYRISCSLLDSNSYKHGNQNIPSDASTIKLAEFCCVALQQSVVSCCWLPSTEGWPIRFPLKELGECLCFFFLFAWKAARQFFFGQI